MRQDPSIDARFQIRTARSIQGSGSWQYASIPFVSPYDRQADPVLDANPFDIGLGPKRVYLTSLQFQAQPTNPFAQAGPSAVMVHRSDDGGKTWAGPAVAASNTDTNWSIDKPEMVVSLHSGTLGNVYVAYIRRRIACGGEVCSPNQNELYIARRVNGGVSFQTPVLLVVGDIQAPQLLVAPSTGRVYLIWVNEGTDQVQMRFTDNCCSASQWSASEVAASGPLYTAKNGLLRPFVGASGEEFTPARTIPQARFDWVNNKVVLVWHEAEWKIGGIHRGISENSQLVDTSVNFVAAGVSPNDWVINWTDGASHLVTNVVNSTTLKLRSGFVWNPSSEGDFDFGDQYTLKHNRGDIYYAAKSTSGWSVKVRLNLTNRSDDQIKPSVDFDESGRLIVGFADRSADSKSFRPRWIEITTSGSKTSEGSFPNAPANDPLGNGSSSWFGDYTDTFFWNFPVTGNDPWGPRYHYIFTGRPAGTEGDAYIGAVN